MSPNNFGVKVKMSMRSRKLLTFFGPILGAILVVGLLSGVLHPWQKDFSHTIGILTAKGGVPVHTGHLETDAELFGKYTVFLTATAAPPVAGDIKIELVGPAPISYTVSSRYPPVVPLLNQLHRWYRFEDATLKGVTPGDDIAVVVKMEPPTALGKYELTFTNVKTKQVYLTMPVVFTRPGEEAEEAEGGWPSH